jgi:ATP-dependent Lon protease
LVRAMSDSSGEQWEILPALTLLRGVLFPGMRCCVRLETVEAFGAVREATRSWGEKSLAVFAARSWPLPREGATPVFDIGATAEVLTLERQACCQRWTAELRAIGRLRACAHLRESPFRIARIERLAEPEEDPALLRGLLIALRESARRLTARLAGPGHEPPATALLASTSDPAQALGHAMDLLPDLPIEDQQRTLELPLLSERIEVVLGHLHRQMAGRHPRKLQLVH